MSKSEVCASVLVLTEDSARQAHDTLAALVRKILVLLDGHCQTQRIHFEPQHEQAQEAMRGNFWKGSHLHQVALRRLITTKLLQQNGFVLFHVDGDRPFSERDTSENIAKFQRLLRGKVEELLTHELQRKGLSHERERRLKRFFLLDPFYSIEAWLYQNTEVAIALCRKHHGGRHVQRFEAWQADRALLDEVENPKQQSCLGGDHNLQLAQRSFPARAVYDVGKSFAIAIDRLRLGEDLLDALARTRDT